MGDAAQGFDPLSSQGMFFALYSGIKAAESIVFGLENPATPYEEAIRYQQRNDDVFEANQQARSLFYASELRFNDECYWQQQSETVTSMAVNN